ncbi:MAG TPA: hypothetical protein VLW84_00735 [Terriglobales bacterium]|nr:hypothetical protein [Terriglobales bacterium]
MKASKRRVGTSGRRRTASEIRARREFEWFLKALSSYPERVACDPDLSFERHVGDLVYCQLARNEAERRRT